MSPKLDVREEIEREAVAAAAMYPTQTARYYPRPHFYFDLNSFGSIYTPIDPKSVLKLVEIMRKHDDSEYGHHSALLNQIVDRSELGGAVVRWHRAQYASHFGEGPETTLRAWLFEQGHPFIPPNIRKAFDEWERGDHYLGDEDGGSPEPMDVYHSAKKLLDLLKEEGEQLSAYVPEEAVRQRIEEQAAKFEAADELEQRVWSEMDPKD